MISRLNGRFSYAGLKNGTVRAVGEAWRTIDWPDLTEVPQVTSYRFVLAGKGVIAMVDPATRRVVQVIQP